MRTFAMRLVLPALLFGAPLAMKAQLVAAGAAGAMAAAPHLAAAAPAILTGAVSAGSAHVGQAVLAKLVSSSMLSDGTKLPMGTQLLGKVTQAVPFHQGSGQSALGMAFDRFRLPGGQERQMSSSILQSIRSGQGSSRNRTDQNTAAETDATSDASVGAQANANVPAARNPSNGGLLGGVGSAVGGVVNGAGDVVGQTVNGLAQTTGSLVGVVLNSTGTLTAQGRNVSVPAGTQVSIGASADVAAR